MVDLSLTFRVQWRKICPRCHSRLNSWTDSDTTGFGICRFGWFTNTIWFILVIYGSVCLLFTWNIKRYYTWTDSNYVNVGCSILQETRIVARTVSSNGIINRSIACSSTHFSYWCYISHLRLRSRSFTSGWFGFHFRSDPRLTVRDPVKKIRISEKFCHHIFNVKDCPKKQNFEIFRPRNFSKIAQRNSKLQIGKCPRNFKILFFGPVFHAEKYGGKILRKFEFFGFLRNSV